MSAAAEILRRLSALGVEPRGASDDSRLVRPGDLFLAYPGDKADGRRYIDDAITRGAAAILFEGSRVSGDALPVPALDHYRPMLARVLKTN